jgi:hypothetical protein
MVTERKFPALNEEFNFNEKFVFDGSSAVYERPIRTLRIEAKAVNLSVGISGGEGPFSYRNGSLWNKEPAPLTVVQRVYINGRGTISNDDNLQVIGKKAPKFTDLEFSLVLISEPVEAGDNNIGTLQYFEDGAETGILEGWNLTVVLPRQQVEDLLNSISLNNLVSLSMGFSVRDGFADGHNEPKYSMTWWFPLNAGSSAWSKVFLENLRWTQRAIALSSGSEHNEFEGQANFVELRNGSPKSTTQKIVRERNFNFQNCLLAGILIVLVFNVVS